MNLQFPRFLQLKTCATVVCLLQMHCTSCALICFCLFLRQNHYQFFLAVEWPLKYICPPGTRLAAMLSLTAEMAPPLHVRLFPFHSSNSQWCLEPSCSEMLYLKTSVTKDLFSGYHGDQTQRKWGPSPWSKIPQRSLLQLKQAQGSTSLPKQIPIENMGQWFSCILLFLQAHTATI